MMSTLILRQGKRGSNLGDVKERGKGSTQKIQRVISFAEKAAPKPGCVNHIRGSKPRKKMPRRLKESLA